MERDKNKYRLSDKDHKDILQNEIVPKLFSNDQQCSLSLPKVIVFAGQPGCGKTRAIEEAQDELDQQGGALLITSDDLRYYHPQYEWILMNDDVNSSFYTNPDADAWRQEVIAEAKERRLNFIVETTMRNSGETVQTLRELQNSGYYVDVRVLAVSMRLSSLGVLLRYERMKADRGVARMSIAEAQKAGYEGMPISVELIEQEKVANIVTVWRRSSELIYLNELLPSGEWINEPAARVAIEVERRQPMSLQVLKTYCNDCDKLYELITDPYRNATEEEISNIVRLREEAYNELRLNY